MICVQGKELDFDITAPEDLRRYRAAGQKMSEVAATLPAMPQDTATEEGFAAYIAWIEAQCRLLTDFLDQAFGDGTCNALLGTKTSVDKLLTLCDAVGSAVEEQGRQVGVKIQKYTPNRATRRKQP